MTDTPERPSEPTLESWKAIAAYLNRDVRTAKRWETQEGLPVRRHHHHARSSVYAYASEIDAWRAKRRPEARAKPRGWVAKHRRVLIAVPLLVAVMLTAGDGRASRRTAAAAQDGSPGIRQVWTGQGVDLRGRVSSDGRFLSLGDADGNLAIRDLLTGEARALTTTAGPGGEYVEHSIWARDNTRLAYAWGNANGNYDVRVIDRAGGTPRILHALPDPGWIMPFDWSPDGGLIAVWIGTDDGAKLGLLSVADGSMRALKSFDWRSPENMTFSPDGRFIAYDFAPAEDGRSRDVFIIATDGSRENIAIEHTANDRLLGWFPDGSRLLFTSDRRGTNDVYALAVREGITEGDPLLLARDLGEIWAPMGFTNTGEFLFGTRPTATDVQLAAVDATGLVTGEPTPVEGHFSGNRAVGTWSPDGSQLAFLSRLPFQGNFRVLSIYSPGTGEVRTVSHALSWFYPSLTWATDGRSLLLTGRDVKGRGGLHRVDVRTGRTEPYQPAAVTFGSLQPVAFSPDGQFLLHVPGGPGEVLTRLQLATGAAVPLLASPSRTFALSPDGRDVAVLIRRGAPGSTPGGEAGSPHDAIAIVPVSGGEPREIFTARNLASTLAWSADGTHVLFARRAAGIIGRVPASGGPAQDLPVAVPNVTRLSLNSRRLAISTSTVEPQVWALDGLSSAIAAGR